MQVSLRASEPVLYEVIVNALTAIPNEMSIRIVRSGTSTVFRETMEFSTALCDLDGTVVAQGVTLPVHVGALPAALPLALPCIDDWQPGDVVIFNDPEFGGLHLPDIFVLMPVFIEGVLFGFSSCTGHHVDVGGRVPGGNAADSTSIYEEGLRIPPIKLWSGGRIVKDVAQLVRKNCRIPDVLMGDLSAQRAACEAGVKGLQELARRYPSATIRQAMREYVDYSAALFTERLARIPEGEFVFEDAIEWLNDLRVVVRCTVRSKDGRPSFDFAGSSDAVDFAINCPFSYTQSAVATVLLSVLGHGVPLNGGLFRAFDVTAPPGSVVSWRMPHACAARGVTMYRVCDAVFGALAQALPGEVPAAAEGGATLVTIAGEHTAGHFNFFDVILGAWGGRQGMDGISGLSNPATNSRNTPVEMIEREYPVRVTEYGMAQGKYGEGEFRGGNALRRGYELLADSAILVVRSDRKALAPWGLYEGHDGTCSMVRIRRAGGACEEMPSKFTARLARGDRVEILTPSGAGYGAPGRRSPEALRRDALDEV
jgi:N-methylhydantoinase B